MDDLPSKENELFDATRKLPASERAAYLEKACAGDEPLRQRVEAKLHLDQEAGTILSPRAPVTEKAGDRIERYRLLQEIGEGGCGIVYMAEQQEPVRRRVALKVIKLGMDTRQIIARFEAERQALAMMDHPNIAKVFDGGVTETGRPYFVMELVRGVPITEYCDTNNLSTRERLELFIHVCKAIQHAHQKGIIHRDIKPSNILVTLHDSVPVPKVIDFGIAKAIDQPLTEKTLFTRFEQLIGTPAYMSPEQAEMSGLDIDTRSDIYSLGVLLYELLTGEPPFDPETLVKSGVDAMRKTIREVEPPRPSTRLSTLAAADLTAVAKKHATEPGKLSALVRGDLDWIVMKCLEKDRTRRYDTANGLAMDVQRHLDNQPVSAAAPSTLYRARKFVRRHKAGLATAVALALLLVGGAAVSIWQAVRATRARQVATREAHRAKQTSRLLQEMLEGVRPARARGRDVVMLREILDVTAARIDGELRDQPDVALEMHRTIGRTYEALGVLDSAESMLRAAASLAEKQYGRHDTNTALALADLAFTLRLRSEFNEATNLLQEALVTLEQQLGTNHAEVAGPLHRLGSVYSDLGKYTEAAPLLTRAVEIRRRTRGEEDHKTIDAESDLATLWYLEGRLPEAEAQISHVVEIAQRVFGEDDPGTADALAVLAFVRQDQGRFAEAEGIHLRLLDSKRRVLGAEHPYTLASMSNLAIIYGYEGRYAEAEQLCRTATESYRRQLGGEDRNTLTMQLNLAEYLRDQGRFSEAEPLFQQTLDALRRTVAADDRIRLETENSMAVQYFMQGRYADAEPLLRNVLQRRRSSLAADDPALADALAQMVLLLLAQEKYTEAEPLARQCLAIQTQQRPDSWRRFVAQSQLGGCLLSLGRNREAEPLLVQAAGSLKERETTVPMIDRARVREAFQRVMKLYDATGRPDEAARWRQEAEHVKTNAPDSSIQR